MELERQDGLADELAELGAIGAVPGNDGVELPQSLDHVAGRHDAYPVQTSGDNGPFAVGEADQGEVRLCGPDFRVGCAKMLQGRQRDNEVADEAPGRMISLRLAFSTLLTNIVTIVLVEASKSSVSSSTAGVASPARPATDILAQIGNTPLLRLQRITRDLPGIEIYGKAEYFNPGGSVKDRPALNMILDGERTGKLKPGGTILDSTSGNTGIAYAMVRGRPWLQSGNFACPPMLPWSENAS